MKVLVVGTHPNMHQISMHLFSKWLQEAASNHNDVSSIAAPAILYNSATSGFRFAKWLHYIDQFAILTLVLSIIQFQYDAVICADHSNSPSLAFVQRRRKIAMVHDTIAMRQGLGLIAGENRSGFMGRLLQRWTVQSLKSCHTLLSNPGPVVKELRDFGFRGHIEDLGCPFESQRLNLEVEGSPLPGKKFILNVGSDIKRKRKAEIINLWHDVESINDNLHLVFAGRTGSESLALIERLEMRRVIILNDASDDTLARLYKSAEAIIIGSKSEGFCIPVLEGLAFQKRILTPTDVPFFAEVFGSTIDAVVDLQSNNGAFKLLEALKSDKPNGYDEERLKLMETYSFSNFSLRVENVLQELRNE